jgi:Putative transposase/Transposase zinc-binding domain
VIRRYGASFLANHGGRLCPRQRQALRALRDCRTAALGGRVLRCNHCQAQTCLYNSCRDRHCPKCQGWQRAKWVEQRRRQLLPVEYFHVVFTVPHELAAIAQAHPAAFYRVLFSAVRETLLELAADPKHLGAALGGLMVLHTWGQNLSLHPHVHVVVPGGGLSADGTRWISCPAGFFLPVKVLSRLFRGKLLAKLKEEYRKGLKWTGSLARLANPPQFSRFLTALYRREWVVYSKPPFGGPEQVLKYLARYTHRVAISNERIESLEDGRVTFRYKDYTGGGRWRRLTLDAHEFLRRFLLHILPKGLMRIRTFGLLANRCVAAKLARCRQLLALPPAETGHTAAPHEPPAARDLPAARDSEQPCPQCGRGVLEVVEQFRRPPPIWDSS